MLITIEVDKAIIELTPEEVDTYLPLFPTHKPSSVLLAMAECKRQTGGLDQVTMNHLMTEKECGGEGMGEAMPEEDIRHIRMLCSVELGQDAFGVPVD